MYFSSRSVTASRLLPRRLGRAWLVLFLGLFITGLTHAASTVTSLTLSTPNDIAYDAVTGKIYFSTNGTEETDFQPCVVPLDPVTFQLGAPINVTGVRCRVLAISDDSQFLYLGVENGSVARITLATQTVDAQFDTAGGDPFDLAVLPGHPHSIVVSGYNTFSIAVLDDGVPRPATAYDYDFESLAFGSSPDLLYGSPESASSPSFDRFAINSNGIALMDSTSNLLGSNYPLISDGTLVYGNDGQVIDPKTRTVVATLPVNGLVCPDLARNRIYVLQQTNTNGVYTTNLVALDATTYTIVATTPIPAANDQAYRVIRCGGHRLAFICGVSNIIIVDDDSIVPSVIGVSLPATTVEGAGTLPAAGQVTLTEVQPTDTVINLTSGNLSKITVPAQVTIPAGQLSASFDIAVINNALLDGPQTVSVSAAATGFATASSNIQVNDDEQATLSVFLPINVTQGGTVHGTVFLSAPPDNDIVVHLASNTNAVTIPATVTIAAGHTTATFDLTANEAGQFIGFAIATITAHVDNWTDGNGSVTVTDPSYTNWTSFGNGAGHTGYQPILTGHHQYIPGWSVTYDSAVSLQQVTVAGGVVQVAPTSVNTTTAFVSGLDVATGGELWRQSFNNVYSFSAPTVDAGHLFVQTTATNLTTQPFGELYSLDATTGQPLWNSTYIATNFDPVTPVAALNGQLWLDSGYTIGLAGFDATDGHPLFANTINSGDGNWFPAWYNGTLYTWDQNLLNALDPATGVVLWSTAVTPGGPQFSRTPALANGLAFGVSNPSLFAINLTTHAVAWSASANFQGTPAVAHGVVYGISGGDVLAYDAQTGAPVGTYSTGDAIWVDQPIVTYDSLIVSSLTQTYIFNLQTFTLDQTLPFGGYLSLANGILYIAGVNTPTLQTYRPDGMTTVTVALPASIIEGDVPATGTVSISAASSFDTVIALTASDPARLLLPTPNVTIPANQTSATFPVIAVDDALANGSETITVTAKGPNFLFAEGRTAITVNDNESDTLALSGAAVVTKGGKYQVNLSLTQAPDSDVRIALSSTNPDLSLPPFIVIPAGQSSVTFDVYAEDDGIPSGTQPAVVTAHVAGWTDGIVSLSVLDNGRDATTGWLSWGNGPAHSGYQPVATGGVLYQAGWTSTLGSQSLGGFVTSGVASLNPVAVADGVLYASAIGTGNVSAADASTGVARWQVALQGEISQPTVDAGKVYIEQIGLPSTPFGALWRFDGASGATDWSVPLDTFGTEIMAPVVFQDGLSVAGGIAGLYGLNVGDGSQRFYDPSPAADQWTPAYHDGVVYSWATDIFSANDAVTGGRLWTLPLDARIPNVMESDRAPAISGGQAFVVGSHALFAIDLLNQKAAWQIGGTFTGTPAVANNVVYAISNNDVLAYNAQTGALVATYSTPDSTLAGQPLVTNDTLIVSSPTQTFLFNLATQALQQTLPNGGGVSLANNILFIAGGDGVVRSYYPPGTVLADTAITQTITPASAPNGTPITITLTITNSGPATATAVVVRDALPSTLTYVSATSTQGTCSASLNNVTCDVGDLPVGATVTVTITATSDGTINVLNTASVSSDVYDANSANNRATAIVNPVAPTVTTGPSFASGVAAGLNGNYNGHGLPATISFDYGFDTSYGSNIPGILFGSPGSTSFSASLRNLLPNTTYHYRARATSAAGSGVGSDMTFNTGSPLAQLTSLSLTAGTLSPTFASGTASYTASVSSGTASVVVNLTYPNNGSATVNGQPIHTFVFVLLAPIGLEPGGSSDPIPLTVGPNAITIVTTGLDGSTATYTVVVTRRTPLQDWASGAGLPDNALDPLGDFNGDGLKNILKWAFLTDFGTTPLGPIQVSSNAINGYGTPVLLTVPNGSGGLDKYALFGRRVDAAGVGLNYSVEFSADLSTWVPSTDTPTVVATDGTLQAVTVPFPSLVNGVPPKYFHVKVTGQ